MEQFIINLSIPVFIITLALIIRSEDFIGIFSTRLMSHKKEDEEKIEG
jgi:hypothetical protein